MQKMFPLLSSVHIPKIMLASVVFATALWLYTSTALPGINIQNGDWAEIQRAAYRLGIARSTGYPVYTMMGYAAAYIGESLKQDPYTWITYTSSFSSAIAAALFLLMLLRLSPAPVAFATTGLLISSRTFWHISTIADVQALNALCINGLFLFTVIHLQERKRIYPLVGMAFFAGLGLANHRTIVLVLPAIGLAFLLSGAWRHLRLKSWLLIIFVGLLPLFSYSYLYIRAEDPNVVYSTRPSWFPAQFTTNTVTDLIRGSNQEGESLEVFFKFPDQDFDSRYDFVWNNLNNELPHVLVLIGLAGLGILLIHHWRIGIVFSVTFLVWFTFLMGWRLEKAIFYQYPLVIFVATGIATAFSFPFRLPFKKHLPRLQMPLLVALLSLPLFQQALHLYLENRPVRDLSDDKQGEYLLTQMQYLPPESVVWTVEWSSEIFVLLEYLDTHRRTDVLPRDTALWWVPIEDMKNPELTVYITPTLRSLLGLYDGATWFQQESGVAFSGTDSPLFLQARRPDDPRLQEEADSATIVHAAIAPEVELYSYNLVPQRGGLRLTLFWRSLHPTSNSYAVYTHLRYYGTQCQWDGSVRLLSQDDSPTPVRLAYPTWLWQEGEIVKDTYLIAWPKEPLPANGVAITLGLTLNGERMQEFCLPLQGENSFAVDFAAFGVPVQSG